MHYLALAFTAAIFLFVVLKLAGVIALSWWWLSIPFAVLGCYAVIIGIVILALSRGV